ncbi:MAG: hypothetical protein II628_16630, partial [Lachnospiraceae bacterium]|nr:hypothetical protein [Lachnospiraceae bacterium]
MKKKLVSLILCSVMAVGLLAGCGGGASDGGASGGGSGAAGGFVDGQLNSINIIVDGTITATVDAGQAEFKAQWEEAVGEKL